MKDIIFFTDIVLFQECEVAARLHSLPKAQDFIIQCCENFVKKDLEKNISENIDKNNSEKIIKKPLDLWLALDNVKKRENTAIKMADFIETICRNELHPPTPAVLPQPVAQKGIMQKIGDAMTLPRS